METDCVTIVVKGMAPSENHALNRARSGRMYPSKLFQEWKRLCEKVKVQKIVDSTWYEVERTYYFPLFFKNGQIRKKDVTNCNKYTDDELVKRLITYSGKEIDDKQIISGYERKVDCKEGEERTEWTIYSIGQ